ncbi:MAG: cation:proton antiporter domain-containing protein [Gaiellales bacterium]
MNEITSFGLIVLTVAGAAAALLATSQITIRLRFFPAPAFFLLGTALVSNLLWDTHPVLPIRNVERIAVVALIIILFDGGINVGWHRFRSALPAIGLLGIGGTAATAVTTALFAHYLLGFHWILAGILGAALAPTDPAVILSVLRGWHIVGRTSTALAGELGLNDAVSIALVIGLVDYAHSSQGSLLVVARDFGVEIGVGAAVGGGIGLALPFLLRHARFPAEGLYGMSTLIAAAIAYGAAAYAHGSGFLAAFIVGVLLGAERTPYKGEIERFSRALASFAEMAVFAALGLTVDLETLGHRDIWQDGLLISAFILLVVRPVVVMVLLSPLRMRWNERLFTAWAGMKGAAPILLAAVAVVAGFESERMYGIVFIAVLVSVVVQGSTVHLVARTLGIASHHGPSPAPETRRYRVAEGSRGAGAAVRDLPLGETGWVHHIVRGGRTFRPRGREVLRPGDEVLAQSGSATRAKRLGRVLEEPRRPRS